MLHLPGILAPVLAGRRALVLDADGPLAAEFPFLPANVLPDDPDPDVLAGADALLSCDAAALIRAQPHAPAGTLCIWLGDCPLRPGQSPHPRAAPHLVRLAVRRVTGTLLVQDDDPDPPAVRLHGRTGMAAAHLVIWSLTPFPRLPLGLHDARSADAGSGSVAAPWRPPAATCLPDRSAAVRLGRRLQLIEAAALAATAADRQLLAGGGGVDTGLAADKRDRFAWPLAQAADRGSIQPRLYDRRPDDAVLHEAARGDALFARYALDTDRPDYAGLVAALNEMPAALDLRPLAHPEPPDVSIVIPVYGQLGYLLNTLHSLLAHRASCSAEIIVVDDCSQDRPTAAFAPQIARLRYHRCERNGGFIAASNIGASMARGRYVVMLNSDVRVVDGWLDALVESFARWPDAGLVGAKLLYPDGTLQEAGGILWRDGSAWNYGRGDDPNWPDYCHARQVDYISGCSIMLRTDVWRQLGGFDTAFSPAYADDADLALRVRALGLQVWLQPRACVVHYEGRTSGTDLGSGAKAYQVINLRRLFLRWRTTLETHRRNGDQPALERDRSARRRLLVIDSVTPTPDQDAGSVQTVLSLYCAAAAGYKVMFVPQDNWLFVPGYTHALQEAGVECAYAPYEISLDAYLRRHGRLLDVVMVFRVHVMDRCMDLLRRHAPQAVVIFHVADLHYLRMERTAALDGSAAIAAAAAALKDKELGLIAQADCTVTHSTVEARLLAQLLPAAPVVVWPLMMPVAGTTAGYAGRCDICFLGGYRHPPNVDAVLYFVRAIFPRLRRAEPGIRFIIAGSYPPDEIAELACDDIVVAGMVPDLRDVFDPCRVFVCPLRVGAGVKGKIASALAHGIPIVSTTLGVEGAGLRDGVDVLVADSPARMAAAILRVYRDPALWQGLSQAGLATIRDAASTEMGTACLRDAIDRGYRQHLGLGAQPAIAADGVD